MDVIRLLKKDHRTVEQLFQKLMKARGERKVELVEELARELLVHAKAEEQRFYPEARKVDDARDEVKDDLEEHQEIEEQLKQLLGMQPDDDGFDDLVAELQEAVEHHVDDEENELFPTLQEHWDDERLSELGEQVQAAKEELEQQDVLAEVRGGGAREKTAGKRYQQSERTKRELYRRAQQLDIEGRSKMTKDELLRAIQQAE